MLRDGASVWTVPGDGNCFYHCIAVHLEKAGLLRITGANRFQDAFEKAASCRRSLAEFYMEMNELAFTTHQERLLLDQGEIPGRLFDLTVQPDKPQSLLVHSYCNTSTTSPLSCQLLIYCIQSTIGRMLFHCSLLSTVTGSSTRDHARLCVLRGDYAHDGDVAAASMCFNMKIEVVTASESSNSFNSYAVFEPEGRAATVPTMTVLYKRIAGSSIGHYDLVIAKPAAAVCVGTSGCAQQRHQAATAPTRCKPSASKPLAENVWQEVKLSPAKCSPKTTPAPKDQGGELSFSMCMLHYRLKRHLQQLHCVHEQQSVAQNVGNSMREGGMPTSWLPPLHGNCIAS
jgi:hypothetical protein